MTRPHLKAYPGEGAGGLAHRNAGGALTVREDCYFIPSSRIAEFTWVKTQSNWRDLWRALVRGWRS